MTDSTNLNRWRRRVSVSTMACVLALMFGAQGAMIHEWNFDETSGTTLADSAGSADASIVVLPGGGGHTLGGGAVRLDGGTRSSADYLSLPDGIFDGLTDVTIEIWAEPHSFPNYSRVIDIGNGDADPNPTIDNFRLSFSDGTDGDHQFMGLRPGRVDAFLPTPVDQVYHHVIVWSSNGGPGGEAEIRWYRDGELAAAQAVGSSTIAVLADLPETVTWLGRSAYTADGTANASFHAVRIYDTALGEAEILLNTLKGPDRDGPDGVDGLVHRWSFSESAGTSLEDSVGTADGQVIVPGGGGGGHSLDGGALRLFGGDKATSDYVEMPSGLLDGLTEVTVEAWVTPHSAQNWSRLFDFGSGTTTDNTFFLSLARGTSLDLQRYEFDTPFAWRIDTALPTSAGQEYHYVAVWSATGGPGGGGRAAWYRDGVLAGEIDTGATTVADVDDAVLWLGRSQWPDATADASFNEFRLYNRALTQAEINFNRLNGPDNISIPPPEVVDDFVTLNPGAMALVPVLANDTGSRGVPETLTVVQPPSFGTTEVKPGGRILYSHDGGGSTSDQFTYEVQNSIGATSEVATVFVTVDPSLRLANTTITIPNEPPPVAYGVVDAFPGLFFEDALAIRTPPGVTNQLFVVERRGIISYIPDIHAAEPVREVFLDISDRMRFDDTPQGEMGLLSMDFHPGFATNGHFFVFYMTPPVPTTPYFDRLSRFTADPVNLTVNTNTEQVLFDVRDQAFNHNGGDIHFGPDGYLYIGMGDEGDQYNFRENSQRIDKDLFSALLRIDVDRRPGSVEPTPSANDTTVYTNGEGQAFYAIPPDNPYVGATEFFGEPVNPATLRTEIFATGFRHIWRFWIDPVTEELWVPDVGQDLWEEVNLVTNGGNYGWAYYEGTHLATELYPGQSRLLDNPPPGLAFPIYEYIHAGQGGDPNFHGDSVTGGVVSRGANLPELFGAYLFADFEFQNIWALRRDGTNVSVERLAAKLGIAAFGTDPSNGDVLLANYFDNQIQRLVRTDAVNADFPQKLSDTGIFADLETLAPNPGIVSYEPKIAFWSDHAIKTRWFTIENLTDTVDFAVDDNWSLPTGMKWIKHFDLELERGNPATKKRLETRVLVKTDERSFGVSYKWNDEQTEAFLVPDEGDTLLLTVTNAGVPAEQMYEIPSRAGCLACHTPGGGHALTFNTREMNHTARLNGTVANQIDALQAAGYFSGPVPPADTLPVHAQLNDESASLEFRSRSYLAVNCAQCHQAGGTGGGAWDARAQLTLEETGLIHGLLDNDGGVADNRLIVPGDPTHSVLWLRLQATNGFGRMPPLGSHELDEAAIQLLAQWISSGLTNRFYDQFQVMHFGSTNNPAGAPGENPDGDRGDNYYEFLTKTDPNLFGDEWLLRVSASNGQAQVSYDQVPNLGVLIEAAPGVDQPWQHWDVPGNTLWFPSATSSITLSGPLLDGGSNQYFRARLVEP